MPLYPNTKMTNSVVSDPISETAAEEELRSLAQDAFENGTPMENISARVLGIVRRLGIDWCNTRKSALVFLDRRIAPSKRLWGKRTMLEWDKKQDYTNAAYYDADTRYFEFNVKDDNTNGCRLITISAHVQIPRSCEFRDLFDVVQEGTMESKHSLYCRVVQKVVICGLRGCLHTDLKPENIMVDLRHEPYLVDWEFSRRLGSQQLSRGSECYVFIAALCNNNSDKQLYNNFYKNKFKEDWWALMVIAYVCAQKQFLYPIEWVFEGPDKFAELIDKRFEEAKQDVESSSLQAALLGYGQQLHKMMQTDKATPDNLRKLVCNK